jgi:hypothetical protein
MAANENQDHKNSSDLKPGSSREDAQAVGGEGDFGESGSENNRLDRDYVSRNTKRSDPGAAQPRSGTLTGGRESGAGGSAVGTGASSGGDIDTDIVGVGTGGSGIAQSGVVNRPPGPDDSDGSSREFASGPPAKGEKGPHAGKVEGTTVDRTGGGRESTPQGEGADSATSPARFGDDSFKGEISSGEAGGQGGA